jgi:hypothetical protein
LCVGAVAGGDPVTRGTRYIIAAFLYNDAIDDVLEAQALAGGGDGAHCPDAPARAAVEWKKDGADAATFAFGFGGNDGADDA